jgi:hypothetical protein
MLGYAVAVHVCPHCRTPSQSPVNGIIMLTWQGGQVTVVVLVFDVVLPVVVLLSVVSVVVILAVQKLHVRSQVPARGQVRQYSVLQALQTVLLQEAAHWGGSRSTGLQGVALDSVTVEVFEVVMEVDDVSVVVVSLAVLTEVVVEPVLLVEVLESVVESVVVMSVAQTPQNMSHWCAKLQVGQKAASQVAPPLEAEEQSGSRSSYLKQVVVLSVTVSVERVLVTVDWVVVFVVLVLVDAVVVLVSETVLSVVSVPVDALVVVVCVVV